MLEWSLDLQLVPVQPSSVFIPDDAISEDTIMALKRKGYSVPLVAELVKKLGQAQASLARRKLFDKPESGSNKSNFFDD